jgi:flagellar assembly protein FliH
MATVIKATVATRAGGAAAFTFDELGEHASEHLDVARRQAAEILAGAEQEAIAIRQRAQEQGRSAALEAAQQVLDENVGRQLATLVPALGEAIDAVRNLKAEWLAHWEKAAIHLAAAIAGRVIRRQVERQPEITLELVREALELAAGCGEIQLRMHPEDVAALGSRVEQLTGELTRLGAAEILADPSIAKGSCRVDTRFGAIDQQFAAQLSRIEEELS